MKRSRRLSHGPHTNHNFNSQREELLEGFQTAQEYIQSETDKIVNDPSYTPSQKIELLNAYKAEYNQIKNEYAEVWEDINQRELAYLSEQGPEQPVDPDYSNPPPEIDDPPAEFSSETEFDGQDYRDYTADSASEEASADMDYCDLPEESSSEEASSDVDYCDLPEESSSETNATDSQDQSSGQGSDNGMDNDM